MRRTRWTFAAAMLLLALGATRPTTAPEPPADRTLDFTGIEHLRLASNRHFDIEVGGRAPVLEVHGIDDVDVEVERDGDTLLVTASLADGGYFSGTLVVPARLRSLDIHGEVDIEAKRPVGELRITTTSALGWEGDAGRLEIVRRREPPGTAASAPEADADADAEAAANAAAAAATGDDYCDCGGVVDVDGAIDALFVTADEGKVYIDRAGGHGHVTLDLAESVTFDLENAVDLEGVTLVRHAAAADVQAVEAASTTQPQTPTAPEATNE